MTFSSSNRAVSPVLGGILVFGLAMSLLVLTQVSVVPAANQQIEFEHNQALQEDFESFQSANSRVAASGGPESVEFDLGVRYPNRFFLVNPAPSSGTLATEAASITIANVAPINPETDEYITSLNGPIVYDTNRLTYQPNYRQYANAPRTVFENGAIFNQFDGDVTLAVSTTPVVSDGHISLVVVDGDVSEQGTGSTSLDLQPASAPSQRLAVTDTGTPITITVQTLLPESEWQAFADGEADVTLTSYTTGSTTNTVELELAAGKRYTLGVAKVTIGANAAPSTPAYVTSVGEYQRSIPAQSSITYTVEVRDQYHNGISIDRVEAEITGPATFTGYGNGTTATIPVDELGRATVTVVGEPNQLGTVTVSIGRDASNDGAYTPAADGPENGVDYQFELVTTNVTEVTADVGSAINPGPDSGGIVLGNVTRIAGTVTMDFENTGTTDRTAVGARLNYYFSAAPGVGGTEFDYMELRAAGTNYGVLRSSATWTLFPESDPIAFTNGAGNLVEVDLKDENGGSYYPKSSANDFFMLTFEFDDGSTKVYIVPVEG